MILDSNFPPDPRVENEAIALINAGHTVCLFCLTYGDEPLEELINQIKVKRYRSNTLEYKLSALAYTLPFYSKIMRKKICHFLIKNSVEVIHIHDIRIAEAAFLANKSLQLPIVLDLHENRPEIMKAYAYVNQFPGRFLINPLKWKEKEAYFTAKASKVITVTEAAKKELCNRTHIAQSNVVVVPNTIRKSFYQEAEINTAIIQKYASNFVLLYIGDTGLRRGLETVITSLKELKEKIPNILLVIVGKNKTADTILQNLTIRLGLENQVDFQGWQEPTFLRHIYKLVMFVYLPYTEIYITILPMPIKYFSI